MINRSDERKLVLFEIWSSIRRHQTTSMTCKNLKTYIYMCSIFFAFIWFLDLENWFPRTLKTLFRNWLHFLWIEISIHVLYGVVVNILCVKFALFNTLCQIHIIRPSAATPPDWRLPNACFACFLGCFSCFESFECGLLEVMISTGVEGSNCASRVIWFKLSGRKKVILWLLLDRLSFC